MLNITESTEDDGSYMWAVPEGMPAVGNYELVIRSVSTPELSYCVSDGFTLALPASDSIRIVTVLESHVGSFIERYGIAVAGIVGVAGLGVATVVVLRRRSII